MLQTKILFCRFKLYFSCIFNFFFKMLQSLKFSKPVLRLQSVFISNLKHMSINESPLPPKITKESRPKYAVLSAEELRNLVDENKITLVDVREPHEVRNGRVPAKKYMHVPLAQVGGAFNLNSEVFLKYFGAEMPSRDCEDIVVMCNSGVRSTWALQMLHGLGYHKSKHFLGGWVSWKESYPDHKV